jgi:cation:H+ antiporter
MLLNILLIIIGFILLIKGADFLVSGSSKIAKKFHIPEIIIGLTIVSIGTSMPELFVSITSAVEGYSDMALGNVIGSNICNLLLILGLSSVIRPIKFQKETRIIELPLSLLLTIIFWIICFSNNFISKAEGILLLVLFLGFIIYTIYMGLHGDKSEKKSQEVLKEEKGKFFIFKNIVYIIIGIIALKYGGDFVVDNSVEIAELFNISDAIISLTILAIGTSLPELVTSVTAAIKGNSDIAIGNIIGSNIFNMLMIIGVSASIKPITYNPSYNIQMIILLIAIVFLALFPFIKPKNEMSRGNGIVYIITYIVYMVLLFII